MLYKRLSLKSSEALGLTTNTTVVQPSLFKKSYRDRSVTTYADLTVWKHAIINLFIRRQASYLNTSFHGQEVYSGGESFV